MNFHDTNARYLGLSLLGLVSIALSIWGIRLSYHPPVSPSAITANSEGLKPLRRATTEIAEPRPLNPKSADTPFPKPSSSEASPEVHDDPTWGYSFANINGLYLVRMVGFPDDLDDASIRSLIRYDLNGHQVAGKPTSVITFRASVDFNQQSNQCTGMNGISAVVEFISDKTGDEASTLFKRGSGFACFGNDKKTAELEALGQAFTNMRN